MTTEQKPFNGLNGTIMLNTPDRGPGITGLTIGTTPGEPYGYKRSLKVTVSIRIEQIPGAHETTEHQTIASPLDFAMSIDVWQYSGEDIVTGGQAWDVLDNMDSYTYGEELVTFLKEKAQPWHLNNMRAACAHQDDTVPEDVPPHEVVNWRLDNVPPCPVEGYKYGRKWLVEPLTDEFVQELLKALEEPIKNRRMYVHPDLPGIAGVEEPA